MTRRTSLGTLVLPGLFCLMLPLGGAAVAADQDPWSMVPPMPTSCYQESDGFPAQHHAGMEAVAAAKERQEKINGELAQRVKDMDPMEQANRMQEYMMQNPEEAMKLMQQNADLGASQDEVRLAEEMTAMENELRELDGRYKAALDTSQNPIDAKFKELDVRAQKDLVVKGEGWVYAPWAVKEYNVLVTEKNKAYETLCAGWWGPSGAYQGWLKRYKEKMVARIPAREDAERLAVGFLAAVAGPSDKPFKPVATYQVVIDYTRKGIQVLEGRWRRPEAFAE